MKNLSWTYEGRVKEISALKQKIKELEQSAKEHIRAERYHQLTAEILGILNDSSALTDAINLILSAIKRETGFEAVGIRLLRGDDFPYFVQEGFSNDFLLAENTLVARTKDGGFCRDKNGNYSLECTCGVVISGQTDPTNSLFTPGGSAWTNNSLTLLDLPPDQDPRLHPRNRCVHEGFLSVALIPIRENQKIVGLLQLNDRKKDRFTPEIIRFFEGISASIGVALKRKQVEEALLQSEDKFRLAFQTSLDAININRLEDGLYVDINQGFTDITGFTREDVIGRTSPEIKIWHDPADRNRLVKGLRERGVYENLEAQFRRKDGSLTTALMSARVFMLWGVPHILSITRDISERKRAEQELKRAHDELEIRVQERTAELAQRNKELTIEIAERLRMEQALQDSKKQLQILASQILTAQEDERKRIALEVHDVLGSALSAIKFKVEETLLHLPKDGALNISKPLEALIPLVQNTVEETRRIQADLRPPLLDDLGIAATLSWYCRRFQTIYSNIKIEQAVTIQEEKVPDHLKIALFRITQEAMNNIGKYAQADSVYIGLQKVDGTIELLIKDNGVGFDPESLSAKEISKKGLGLTSMKERVEFSGGSFSIESAKRKGTVIRAVWPV